MHSQELESRKIGAIRPHPKNARTHPRNQFDRLVESIREFGFTSPILLDEGNVILAGHARWQAAREAGLKVVPVIVIRGLSEAKRRAYGLADNNIAVRAVYDRPALAAELEELSALLAEEDLDLSLTGFDPAEIDSLFADLVDVESDPADDPPEIATHPVSRKGDLWAFGDRHRLLCDDARTADYARLMPGEQAAMAFTDPPYNVSIPKTLGRGRTKHRNFAMAAGEMSPAAFTTFLSGCAVCGRGAFGRRRSALCLHGLAAYGGDAGRGRCSLWQAPQSGGVVKDQRRPRFTLPVPARVDIRL